MSLWDSSFFLVLKRPIAYVVAVLLVALAGWKSYDILAWSWKRLSR
jgi:hypothetical protein